MKSAKVVLLLMLLAGCGSTNGTSGSLGTKPTPSLGARPATKKELPWLTVPGGRMKTTLFYGPWQCRQAFMNGCQVECGSAGYPLMGCIWLADLKFDWEGRLLLPPVPVEGGSRYGIYHCCCKFHTLTKAENDAARQTWKNAMKSFRKKLE
ncbi:hypothetical protein [Cystobacter ferrugineus]|uniref:hypothetical protein n=1 Tax=Cystobacter ferrugineus TaxID=83449 RepID=UPI001FE28124|nr:hypothetical protein [Cystobacter ferrugineus]